MTLNDTIKEQILRLNGSIEELEVCSSQETMLHARLAGCPQPSRELLLTIKFRVPKLDFIQVTLTT